MYVIGLLHPVDKRTADDYLFIRFDTDFRPLFTLLLFSCLRLVYEFFKVLHLLSTRHNVLIVLIDCLLISWVVLNELHCKLVVLRDSVFGANLA